MRYLVFTLLAFTFIVSSCKTDGTTKQAKPVYPAIFAEKEVPTFLDGVITRSELDDSERKIDHTVWIETEKSFEDIYQWHKTSFAQNGWKKVKDKRSGIGEDTESILMVHTKGSVKHNIIVLKHTIRTNQIKTTLSYF